MKSTIILCIAADSTEAEIKVRNYLGGYTCGLWPFYTIISIAKADKIKLITDLEIAGYFTQYTDIRRELLSALENGSDDLSIKHAERYINLMKMIFSKDSILLNLECNDMSYPEDIEGWYRIDIKIMDSGKELVQNKYSAVTDLKPDILKAISVVYSKY